MRAGLMLCLNLAALSHDATYYDSKLQVYMFIFLDSSAGPDTNSRHLTDHYCLPKWPLRNTLIFKIWVQLAPPPPAAHRHSYFEKQLWGEKTHDDASLSQLASLAVSP